MNAREHERESVSMNGRHKMEELRECVRELEELIENGAGGKGDPAGRSAIRAAKNNIREALKRINEHDPPSP